MSRSARLYFVLVGLFAAWVGVWGMFVPAEIGRALPFAVPPLHARFIAAMYLAGLLAMALSFVARSAASVRIPIALATIWTGTLFAVSLIEFAAFDFARPQTGFWWGAYAVYPLWGAWLLRRPEVRRSATPRPQTDVLMLGLGVVCLLLAAAMLAAPAALAAAWPWKAQPLVVRVYAGPFVAWGASALLLARAGGRESRRIASLAMAAFALLAIAASSLHLALFRFDAPAAWLWFGGFAVWAAIALRSLLATDRRVR